MIKQVYVGTPQNLEDFREKSLAVLIGDVLSLLGYSSYLPHIHIQNSNSDEGVYSRSMKAISESAFCIFEVTNPSHRVGMEIQKAVELELPIIFIASCDRRSDKMLMDILSIEKKRRLVQYLDALDLHGHLKFHIPLYIDGSVIA